MMKWLRDLNNTRKTMLFIVPLLALLLVVSGCDDDDDDNNNGVAPEPESAQLRVTHLSPDAPPVDIYVDGAMVLSNVDYLAVSEYLELDAGMHNVQVYATGTTENAVIDADVSLMGEMAYTVAAVGKLDNIQPAVFEDMTEPGDDVMLRFVHASPDAPAVDITDMDGNVIFENVSFTEVGNYITVPEDQYNLQVRVAGTETIVLTLSNVMLNAETNYTVWAVGLAAEEGEMGLMAVATAETGSGSTSMVLPTDTALLRVSHLSPDAPPVDVYVDNRKVLENVAYLGVSNYLTVGAGTRNVQVYATGTMDNAVIDADVTVSMDMAYTVAAVGELASIQPAVYMDDRTTAGDVKVRFIHTSPNAPAVDITLADGTPLFEDVSFPEAAEFINVTGGTYDLQVRAAGTDNVVIGFNGVGLNDGDVVTIWAVGKLNGAEAEMLKAVATIDAPGNGADATVITPDMASVRVAHLSPDAPAVDVYVDGMMVLEGVGYLGLSPYLMVNSGSRQIQVFATGTDSEPVIDAVVSVETDMAYTVAATGSLGDNDLEPIVTMDSRETASGVQVRFAHTSPDAPEVDITLPDGTVLFDDVSFRELSPAEGYASLGAGTYDLQVRTSDGETIVQTFEDVELSNETTITVWAVDFLADDGLVRAVVTRDAFEDGSTAAVLTGVEYVPPMAEVRISHLSPDAPNVDVYVDGAMALENVAYLGVSPYLEVEAGDRLVQVFVTGTDSNPVIDATLTFEMDMAYTVAAIGSIDLGSFGPVVSMDQRDGESNVQARFVHASPDAPEVDITLTDGTVLFDNVEFGEFSPGTDAYAGLAGGTYDLQVRTSDGMTIVQQIDGVSLSDGTVYTLWAVDFLSDDGLVRVAATEDNVADGSNVGLLEGYVPMAELRVGHLSPDAPNVDVYFAGEMVLQNVPYLTVSDYLEIPAGTSQVQVYATGDMGSPVIDEMLTFNTNMAYTVAAIGSIGEGNFQPVVTNDSRMGNGEPWVRFVHASPDAPAVDVTTFTGSFLADNLDFSDVQGYSAFNDMVYDLFLRPAGTSDVAAGFAGVPFVSNTNITIWVVGFLGGEGNEALKAVITEETMGGMSPIVADVSGLTEVRVGHLSPDAPAVNVYIDGMMAVGNASYKDVTGYLTLTEGAHMVEIELTDGTPVLMETVMPEADNAYTVAAIGFAGGGTNPLMLNTWMDDRMTSGQAKLRFVHTSPDAPAVDVGVTDGPILFMDTVYPEAADEGYIEVAGGSYNLSVHLSGTDTEVLSLTDVAVMGGTNYSVFAIGTADAEDEIPLEALIVVDAE
ncbi:DUF4397 domain-containing protein [bacterium]|nr:DUF4397 domain-containing protein [bacterium]